MKPVDPVKPDQPWHAMSLEEILRELNSTEQGLSQVEVQKRLA